MDAGADIIDGIIEALEELLEDNTVPKNVKEKALSSIGFLKDDSADLSIKVNKALSELEDLSDDINMQPYTRTQLWNIVSLLEKALL